LPVRVRVYATLRERVKWSEKLVDVASSEVTLSELLERIPDLKRAIEEVGIGAFIVLVNGHNIQLLQGLETRVRDGDVVDVFPQAAGGLFLVY